MSNEAKKPFKTKAEFFTKFGVHRCFVILVMLTTSNKVTWLEHHQVES